MPLVPMTPNETSAMIEEVRSHGFDPAKVRCCIPSSGLPGSVKGIMGCNMSDVCEFHLTKNGGFRNLTWRPKNVAVYVKPQEDRPEQNEVLMSCHGYCQQMRNRARDGRRDMEEQGAGEVLQIVAQEGEEYTCLQFVKENPTNVNTIFVEKSFTQLVPEYKHPTQLAGSAAQREMDAKAKARSSGREEVGPPRVKASVAAPIAATITPAAYDKMSLDVNDTGVEVVAIEAPILGETPKGRSK